MIAIVWLLFNLLDVATTHLSLRLGAFEANPVMAGLIRTTGETTAYSVKLMIIAVAAVLFYKVGCQLLLRPLNMLMAMVLLSNSAVIVISLQLR
jgi:hypothetical protein